MVGVAVHIGSAAVFVPAAFPVVAGNAVVPVRFSIEAVPAFAGCAAFIGFVG
jgi:hypothetical protein